MITKVSGHHSTGFLASEAQGATDLGRSCGADSVVPGDRGDFPAVVARAYASRRSETIHRNGTVLPRVEAEAFLAKWAPDLIAQRRREKWLAL